jgi:hypothetical protein
MNDSVDRILDEKGISRQIEQPLYREVILSIARGIASWHERWFSEG